MPRIATAIREYKQSKPANSVLTLDIGDHMDRMRVETEGSMGAANIAVLNATGYDAVCLGNNEGLTFDKMTITNAYLNHSQFTVLGTNMLDKDTGTQPEWMVPSYIVTRGNLRIGLVGVTAYYDNFYKLLGWNVLEPLQALKKEIRKLRLQDEVHMVIVLSHLGLKLDRAIAKEVDGVDVILGGHTHHLLETPEREGRTWIAATGSLGTYIGELTFNYSFSAGEVTLEEGRCVTVNEFEEDETVVKLIEHYREAGMERLALPVAFLDQPLSVNWYGESELGNLLAAGIRRWTGAEVGLVNAGQLLTGLEAGPVTEGHLLRMCPSPINPCLTLLKGERIVQALEESLLSEFYERPIRGFGFRGQVLGILCVDGLQVHYDLAEAAYHKIKSVYVNAERLDPDKTYSVGMIDMFTFGSGYISLSHGAETEYFLPEFIRDVLQDQLQRPDEIMNSKKDRWYQEG